MTQIAHSRLKLAVVGAGAWGTVLACLLAQNGHKVSLWTRTRAQAEQLNTKRENEFYMPGLAFPENLRAISDLDLLAESQAVIWAIPSKASHEVIAQLPKVPAFISCSKGIESGSFKTVSQILGDYQPHATLSALSGPNLAGEIAQAKPAAATLACEQADFAKLAQGWFNQKHFRVYSSPDLRGVEIAGALKNVIALAAGMSDGLDLGDNAKASLLTRGLAEIIRLGKHMGGKPETFYGLAGLGDMLATCSSKDSRNHRAGELFAQGAKLSEIKLTAEGIPTVKAVYEYAQLFGLELPISNEVFRVVYENKAPHKAINDLMARETKTE